MPGKRKILFVIIDQLRADCIQGALAKHVKLPNIQAFRAQAVTFTNHFSVTNPCGPSRASLLTGLYAMNHRAVRNGTPLDRSTTNLALEARKSGYDPMLFGYTDTAQDPRDFHANDPALADEEMVLPGFHEIVEMSAQKSFPWRADLKSKGYDLPLYSDFYRPVPSQPGQPAQLNDPAFYSAADSDTAFLTDALLKDLAVRTEQNWFATITFIRPHPPFVAPAPYNKMYDPADLPLPARHVAITDEAAAHPFLKAALKKPSMESTVRGFDGQLDPEDEKSVQTLRATYLGLASEVDTHFGRIIAFLKETGQYDDTLIVLTADHGEMLGDHHMWGKQTIYDSAYRIPLIIRDPEHPQQHGQVVDAMTETIDITPTILDLIGGNVPISMNGASLRPFLGGGVPDTWRDCVHMELDFAEPNGPTVWQNVVDTSFYESNVAILRDARFKLVHFNGDLAPLLFDVENDPHEMKNLADDPAHQSTLLRMTQKLLSHRMRHADHSLSDLRITADGVVSYQP